MIAKFRIRKEDAPKIIDLYLDKEMSCESIAKQYRVKPITIRRLLTTHGILERPFKFQKEKSYKKKGIVYNSKGIKQYEC